MEKTYKYVNKKKTKMTLPSFVNRYVALDFTEGSPSLFTSIERRIWGKKLSLIEHIQSALCFYTSHNIYNNLWIFIDLFLIFKIFITE